MARWDPRGRLNLYERLGIGALLLTVIAFTALIEYRSAFHGRRMGDGGVYFRAAWAVRAGVDLYTVVDDNKWSYTYPPTLAIVMAPLADAPAGEPRPWMIPYWASLLVWLVLQWVFMIIAAHWIARAIETASPNPDERSWPPGSRRWWQLRLHPALICLVAIGGTISRHQVNLMLLMFLAGMILCLVRGKKAMAGLWLAAATSLKVIPAFLVGYAIWRRDWRMLAGFAAGMFLILGVIPGVFVGPQKAIDLNRRFLDTMILARFGSHEDKSKVVEHDKAMDNQSPMAASYNIRNPGAIQRDGMTKPEKVDKAVHAAVALLLCGATVGAVWVRDRRGWPRARTDILFIGLLMCAMVAVSPMSHLHYFALSVPLVAILWMHAKERGGPKPLFWILATVYFIANALPHLPRLEIFKYIGMAQMANLALWAIGIGEALRPMPESQGAAKLTA